MSIMTAHYYNPQNHGIWTRAIPKFGIRKSADYNTNLQLYLCTDTIKTGRMYTYTIYNRKSNVRKL